MNEPIRKRHYNNDQRETLRDCWLLSLDFQELKVMCDSLEDIRNVWIDRKLDFSTSTKIMDEIIKTLRQQVDALTYLTTITDGMLNDTLSNDESTEKN